LASHNGSGFKAIYKAILEKELDIQITLVISNNTNAVALQNAKEYNLNNFLVNSKTDEIPDEKIYSLLKEHECEYIFLSGYMKKLSSKIINEFKVLNSHPSLLPKYGGSGMYGRYVHEAVIKNAETESGVSIHKVSEEYDEGEILLQKKLTISQGESVDGLESKIKELEKLTIVEVFKNV
ncbi:MAG: formyltransferase family protein, partial [Campylobacterota bacterium]